MVQLCSCKDAERNNEQSTNHDVEEIKCYDASKQTIDMINFKGVADNEAFSIIGIFIVCNCYNMKDLRFKVCPVTFENENISFRALLLLRKKFGPCEGTRHTCTVCHVPTHTSFCGVEVRWYNKV